MAAVTPQFKIKPGFKQEEFTREAYANFFEANVPAKHKNATRWRKGENVIESRYYFCWQRKQSSEDIIPVVGECHGVKTLFLSWENVTE